MATVAAAAFLALATANAKIVPKSMMDAFSNLHAEVHSYQQGASVSADDLCVDNTCCTVSDTNSCSMDTFAAGESTLVLPGGESRCIFSTSTPYAFQVIPGKSDKLVFYFQGGGACWDEFSTKKGGFCTTDCKPQKRVGIFDNTDVRNEYREHTIVHALYCSGDVWAGDVVRPYDDDAGEPVTQKGLANAQAVLDWTVQQQKAGNIASELQELVVMGCSAGSIGAQLWANQVTEALNWKTAAVVPDSYAGFFPPDTEGPLMYDYGFCGSGFLSDDLTATCNAQQASIRDINMELMQATPTVPRAFLQSKTDTTQMSFYMSVGRTEGEQVVVTPAEFYAGVNDIFETYNSLPNFVTYLVDGEQHCFTPLDVYYTADAVGPSDAGANYTAGPDLAEWTGEFPLQDAEKASTVCAGESTANGGASRKDVTYCDEEVSPKDFMEKW